MKQILKALMNLLLLFIPLIITAIKNKEKLKEEFTYYQGIEKIVKEMRDRQ